MKIIVKNRWDGSVIFEHDADNNSIALTVQAAIQANVSLKSANLEFANLESANLKSANLEFANLESANLEFANLESANLEFANLKFANLEFANLKFANLEFASVDFSRGWQFRCNHSRFKIGLGFAYQVLAHLCSCKSDEVEFTEIREKILPYAVKSHRAGDLGLLDDNSDGKEDACEAAESSSEF